MLEVGSGDGMISDDWWLKTQRSKYVSRAALPQDRRRSVSSMHVVASLHTRIANTVVIGNYRYHRDEVCKRG